MELDTKQRNFSVPGMLKDLRVEAFEHFRRQGSLQCDLEELAACKEAAKAYVRSHAVTPFDPSGSVWDRSLLERIGASQKRMERLGDSRRILAARLLQANEQNAMLPGPRMSLAPLIVTGTAGFSLAFSPTIFAVFLGDMGDPLLGWVLSIAVGSLIGLFLVLNLLTLEEGASPNRRPGFTKPAIGVGVAFGLMRVAKAESLEGILVAAGLTLMECMW